MICPIRESFRLVFAATKYCFPCRAVAPVQVVESPSYTNWSATTSAVVTTCRRIQGKITQELETPNLQPQDVEVEQRKSQGIAHEGQTDVGQPKASLNSGNLERKDRSIQDGDG